MLEPYWNWFALAMVGAFFTGAAIPIFSYFFAVDINVIAGIEGDDMEGDTKQNMVYLAIPEKK